MNKFIILSSIIFISLFVNPVYSSQAVDPSKGFVLSNDYVRFEFEPGGLGLSAMIDLKTGCNHIQSVEGKHLLWEIAFGKGRQIERINNNYKPCNYARIENLPDGSQLTVLEWNELRWWEEDSVVTVQVTVELPKNSGIAKWRIFVENLSDYWGLWEINFPSVKGFPASGVYDIARPTFGSGGHLLKQWKSEIKGRYPSGSFPMQFISFAKGINAVYFAGMDPDARAKDFVANPEKQELTITHYPENMGVAGSDFPDYYPVEFGVYQGGWLESAQHYRLWALQQKWAKAGPVSQRRDIPDLIKNVGLWMSDSWVWNGAEGAPHEMNVPFLEAQKRMGVPMGIHWYNWHKRPFNTNDPYYTPPRDGFTERVKELVDNGILVMPYFVGVSADMDLHDWKDYAPHAIYDEAGGLRHHFYFDGAARLLSMCPNQEFWQDKITVLVDSLMGFWGTNAVYIDQISAMSHELCFDKQHGHPLGGGRYWADGYRDLLRKAQNVAHRKGRDFVITSEAADEIFFDLVNANLTWAQPSDREIPMMQVVYSGYTLFFGSPCDYTKSGRFFNYAQGQALIQGRQNGWMGFGLFKPENSAKADFFRQCGQYRVAAKKFLTFGRLLEPVYPTNQIPTFSEDVFGWQDKHTGTAPSAEAALWQAEDGHLGIFLVNYLNEPNTFSYTIEPAKYGIRSTILTISQITPEKLIPIGSISGTINRVENLNPGEIRVLEITP